MLGTLNGALEARGIVLGPDAIVAEVEGVNELKDRLAILTEVRIHYTLRIPAGSRETVDRTLERHQSKCHTAESLKASVRVSWTAAIEEVGGAA